MKKKRMDLGKTLIEAGGRKFPTETEYISERLKELFHLEQELVYRSCDEIYVQYCLHCQRNNLYLPSNHNIFSRAINSTYAISTKQIYMYKEYVSIYVPICEGIQHISFLDNKIICDFASCENIRGKTCKSVYTEFGVWCFEHNYEPVTPSDLIKMIRAVYDLNVHKQNGKFGELYYL